MNDWNQTMQQVDVESWKLTGFQVAFPVQRIQPLQNGAFVVTPDVLGTCFSIGHELMITAGHVVGEVLECGAGAVAVGLRNPEGRLKGAIVEASEHLDADIGILRVKFPENQASSWFETFKWRITPLLQLETVKCIGYAFGHYLLDSTLTFVPRAFMGYIVSHISRFKPVGWQAKAFGVYELSFNAPVGLSGAPLLSGSAPTLISAVVVGNNESKMLVYHFEEIEKEGDTLHSVEQYEMLRLGIAVEVGEILNLRSELCGGTIGEYLEKQKLLV